MALDPDLCYRAYSSVLACSVLAEVYTSYYFDASLSGERWRDADALLGLLCQELRAARQAITDVMESL